jgi:hypothetical protein
MVKPPKSTSAPFRLLRMKSVRPMKLATNRLRGAL